jgi:hypothetical protein
MTTTKTDARAAGRVRARLQRELAELKLAGLDTRAEAVRRELATVDARLADLKRERQEENSERWRREHEDKARHEAEERRQEEGAQRRKAAHEWLSGQSWNGEPVETVAALAAASREGHRAADVLGVGRRYYRRIDGVEVLAPAELAFLRRDFEPLDEPEPAAYSS